MKPLLFSIVLAVVCTGCQNTCSSEHAGSAGTSTASPSTSLEPLRPGVWVHESYREVGGFGRVLSNGLVVASGSEALLINTAWGADPEASTEAVLEDASRAAGVPVRGAVFSHYHDDSVAGVEALRRAGIPAYATALTADLMAGEGWGRPDSLFAAGDGDVWTLAYGDRNVEVFFAGPGHTADNVVVYVPEARVLFGGCLIRPGESQSLGNTSDAEIEEWAESVDRVRARYGGRVDVVVPTHGAPGGPELLDHTIRLVQAYRGRPAGG